MRKFFMTSLALAWATGCMSTGLLAQTAKPALGAWGIETQYRDPSIKPGDDFYRHVNNGWLKTAKPPAGIAYANSFVDAFLKTQTQLEELIARLAANRPAPGTDEYLVLSLYDSYVNVARLNALGLSPIQADLDRILAIGSHQDAARWMGRPFVKSFVNAGVGSDEARPQRYVLHAEQAGLGLPSLEYYKLTSEPFAGHRTAYLAYIEEVFRRAGIGDAGARAAAILALETAIAETHWTPAERRDPVRGYRLMPIAALSTYAPGFPWTDYLAESGFKDQQEIVLVTDTALQKLATLFAATPVETLRAYLAFHYINSFAPALSEDWQKLNFAFFGARLSGTPEQQPLKDRAVGFVGKKAGEVLGRVYVKSYFPADHRAKMEALVTNLRTAFRKRLEANAWMDEPTRKEALAKLDGITSRIGYPAQWRDYSAVVMDKDDLVGNWRKLAAFELADSIKALGEPRRDWQWDYPAHEINAGYSPSMNSITFPAGILQPPFFDPNADPAVNYGAIGAVIGHEIGHGFDDQGSQSDATGALRNWWTAASRSEFNKRTGVLVAQFNGYSPIKGMNVNGALTLGENIGDLGGITIAYDAYRLFVAQELAGKAPEIDGTSGDQRFFMSWAQLWRDYTTPDQQRQNLLSDVHSPGEFRANGSLRNFDAWYAAFAVQPGDALYLPPDQRVRIW